VNASPTRPAATVAAIPTLLRRQGEHGGGKQYGRQEQRRPRTGAAQSQVTRRIPSSMRSDSLAKRQPGAARCQRGVEGRQAQQADARGRGLCQRTCATSEFFVSEERSVAWLARCAVAAAALSAR